MTTPVDRPTLLIASSGGHLAQLVRLRDRLDIATGPCRWVTFDTPQARSLLNNEDVLFVPYIGPRDALRVAQNAWAAHSILRSEPFKAVVSTGAAIALSFLPTACVLQIPAIYIESAARSQGPSLSGRILSRVQGVRCYTQYSAWASDRWRYIGSVFDGFSISQRPAATVKRIVVTLGTIRGYGFPRLIDRVRQILPVGADVVWQTGSTQASDLGPNVFTDLSADALAAHIANADVVISHAGVGSCLSALDHGRVPILVPRQAKFGEHVDDHQQQVAAMLAQRSLAIHRSVTTLSATDLTDAASRVVHRIAPPRMTTR